VYLYKCNGVYFCIYVYYVYIYIYVFICLYDICICLLYIVHCICILLSIYIKYICTNGYEVVMGFYGIYKFIHIYIICLNI
jgi:hypothetical protein